jgi:DNA-binding transcriptional regulator YiaG
MALGEIGLFNPAESTYMRPGAYDDALRANALKQSSYLSAMDSFYEQLDETVREFNKTLTFKETELAQVKSLTEEQIGLSREELQLRNEQFQADLTLRQQMLKEQTAYQTGMLAVENKKVNIAAGTSYLGGGSASDKAFDFLNKTQAAQTAENEAARAFMAKYMTKGSATPQQSTGYYGESVSINGKPISGEVNYGNIDESSWL